MLCAKVRMRSEVPRMETLEVQKKLYKIFKRFRAARFRYSQCVECKARIAWRFCGIAKLYSAEIYGFNLIYKVECRIDEKPDAFSGFSERLGQHMHDIALAGITKFR